MMKANNILVEEKACNFNLGGTGKAGWLLGQNKALASNSSLMNRYNRQGHAKTTFDNSKTRQVVNLKLKVQGTTKQPFKALLMTGWYENPTSACAQQACLLPSPLDRSKVNFDAAD